MDNNDRSPGLERETAYYLDRLRVGFLGRIAHELRSPLNSIIGLHQLILNDLCDNAEEEKLFLAQAHRATLKLVTMLDRAIALSKLEYGTILPKWEDIALVQFLNDLQQLTELQAAERDITLIFPEPEEEFYIHSDRDRLSTALVILLDTAIEQLRGETIGIGHNILENSIVLTFLLPRPPAFWNGVASAGIDFSPSARFEFVERLLASLKGKMNLTAVNDDRCTRIDCSLPRSSVPFPAGG